MFINMLFYSVINFHKSKNAKKNSTLRVVTGIELFMGYRFKNQNMSEFVYVAIMKSIGDLDLCVYGI